MTTLLDMNTSYIAVGAGANLFDSRNRYLRHQTSTTNRFPIVKGPTMKVTTFSNGTGSGPCFKTDDTVTSYVYTESGGSATSFSATATLVDL